MQDGLNCERDSLAFMQYGSVRFQMFFGCLLLPVPITLACSLCPKRGEVCKVCS